MGHHAHDHWLAVSFAELDEWVGRRPGLQVKPPMTVSNVNFREWCDPALGAWPGNVVATMSRRPGGKAAYYKIRVFSAE